MFPWLSLLKMAMAHTTTLGAIITKTKGKRRSLMAITLEDSIMVLILNYILNEAILSHIFMTLSIMEPHNLCLQLIIQVKSVKFVITKVTLH